MRVTAAIKGHGADKGVRGNRERERERERVRVRVRDIGSGETVYLVNLHHYYLYSFVSSEINRMKDCEEVRQTGGYRFESSYNGSIEDLITCNLF